MTLLSFGDFYVGWEPVNFLDAWRDSHETVIHLGNIRLQWKGSPDSHGSIQASAHQPQGSQASNGS